MVLTARNNPTVVGILLLLTTLSLVSFTVGCSCKITGTERDNPHCGSDGKIYSSLCHLNCERLFKPRIHVKKMTFCLQAHVCRWRCLKVHNPVCGSDSKTYRNNCFFKCNQKRHPKLQIVHQGRCPKRNKDTNNNKRDINKKPKVLI